MSSEITIQTGIKMTINKKEEYQELKQHGSRLFPFDIYPCTIPLDFPTVALHWHKSMELIYVKCGHGQVQLGVEVMDAEKDDIFVVPPGTLHALRQIPGYSMEYENIIFDVDFLGSGAADICAHDYLVPLQAGQLIAPIRIRKKGGDMADEDDYSIFASGLRQVEQLCEEKQKAYELAVKGCMILFLYQLVRRNPERTSAANPDHERLKSVLQRVEQEYGSDLTVQDMADGCGCSSSHFMRWFKKMTGTSFTAYLNERRLAAAAEALKQTDDKILSIAQDVGFTNLSNFNRQFLARYGVTPRKYRGWNE